MKPAFNPVAAATSAKNREKNRCFYQLSHHSVSPTTSEPNSNQGGGGSAPPHPPRLTKHFYCFDLTSREPKNTVFQQNPSVQQAQLDAALDSDAINAAAQSSIHLLGGFFSVCRDLVALRRNPIRSIASRDPICRKSRKIYGFYRISRRRDTIEPNGEKTP